MTNAMIPPRSYGVKLVRGPVVRLAPHPLHCANEDELFALTRTINRPLAADLFCGAGGLSLGLQSAGYQVILGVDHDAEAIETHSSLMPGLSVTWDLSDESMINRVVEIVKRAGVSLIAGGPPCQPFSKAGRSMLRQLVHLGRRGPDMRTDLWQSFMAIVERARPQAVLMENVPDMALSTDMMILRTMVDELESLGYSVETRVVETKRHGVPQHRQRLFVVALRDGAAFNWPSSDGEFVSVATAIGDLPPVDGGARPAGGADGWWAYERPRTRFQSRARANVRVDDEHRIFDHITRPVREDDLRAFEQMDSKTRYSQLDESLRRYRHDIFEDKYKRLDADDVSRTITAHIAKDGYGFIHPWEHRTLTVREAARLQTFPDDVRFAGAPSAAFRQIGNAVPPLIAEILGEAILKALAERRRSFLTTKLVSSELADWYQHADRLVAPWLRSHNRWLVILGELTTDRLDRERIRLLWNAIQHLDTPERTVAAQDQLREACSWVGRDAHAERALLAAAHLCANPEAITDPVALRHTPHVILSVANLAIRAQLGTTEDPVIASSGVLRVAARFWGQPVDRQNQGSDGRIAVARMMGVDPVSDSAQLALVELSRSVCTPSRPDCENCPLNPWCADANRRIARARQRKPS